MTATAIGLDVGGTKILGALVDARGRVLATEVVPTPKADEPLIEAMVGVASGLIELGGPGAPIGVGFPALMSADGVAAYGPNISTRDVPLRERLQQALGRDVTIDNDATCATWAEFRLGAGRLTARHMLMFTLGTGVGGGLVIDGRLVRGANGYAGELGHIIVQAGGLAGPSDIPGELEAYSSGTALVRMISEAVAAEAFAGTPLASHPDPSPAVVVTAAQQGVAPAKELLARMGWYLGVAAAGLCSVLDPELIVVGGGAAAGGELILQPAREALHGHLLGADHRPEIPIVAATLGPEAGAVGAALLAMDA